jgi:hypothetical protein
VREYSHHDLRGVPELATCGSLSSRGQANKDIKNESLEAERNGKKS